MTGSAGRKQNKDRGAEKPPKKKNQFLGTEVPRNFSDQCSLDFAYFLCLFSGRRAKSSQELCSWELFFLILGGFSPSEKTEPPAARRTCLSHFAAPKPGPRCPHHRQLPARLRTKHLLSPQPPTTPHRPKYPQVGGAEMTIILSDNNSRILTAPLSDPLEGGRGAIVQKYCHCISWEKAMTIKMRLSKMLFFLCFRPTIKFQDGSPVDPRFDPPCRPPF